MKTARRIAKASDSSLRKNKPNGVVEETAGPERAILVGTEPLEGAGRRSMRELMLLAQAAGLAPVALLVQVRRRPTATHFLGKGKLAELQELALREGADVVVFNAELSPVQQRNLVDALSCKVLDRTEVILDIFGQRAATREGKLQVEAARLAYELPRLAGRGRMMSRIGGGRRGGVGVRGPGEPQLATERRHIERRLRQVRRELDEIKARRDTERQARRRAGLPLVSLVGYTNAGKSSLLNALVGSEEVPADDQLFETLDPTVRRVVLTDGFPVLVSDTVGFIQDLPHSLVAAFRATLEEVVQADALVHVVDASDPFAAAQINAVKGVLSEIGAADRPTIIALNKWDLAADSGTTHRLLARLPGALPISALTGYNLDELRASLTDLLTHHLIPATARLPYNRLDLLHAIRERGRIITEDYRPSYVYIEAEVDQETMGHLRPFLTGE